MNNVQKARHDLDILEKEYQPTFKDETLNKCDWEDRYQ